ncbi:MAG: response regulator, partial [Bacteroidota bacterium]
MLELEAYEVLTATNGKEGVEIAFSEVPDIIFCDIRMPDLDGYSVLYLIGKNKRTMHIPFIFLTALTERLQVKKGLGLGAAGYVKKPFTEKDLLQAMNSVTRQRTDEEAARLCTVQDITDVMIHAELIGAPISVEGLAKKIIYRHAGLFLENGQPDSVYYVVSGRVRSYLFNDNHIKFTTNLHGPGEFLGYAAILEGTVHKDNAEADEDSVLLTIPVNDFLQLINFKRSLAEQIVELLSGFDPQNVKKIMSLVYLSYRNKVVETLLEISYKTEPHKEQRDLEHEKLKRHINQYAGSINEYLHGILDELCADNLICIKEGNIVIHDEKKLMNLSVIR